jgi:hypothetical protein
MSTKSYSLDQITDDLFRHEAGKIVSVLIKSLGLNN